MKIKGAAICMLLFHHLFYSEYRLSYGGIVTHILSRDMLMSLASYARICVWLFAFVSAYGLAKAYLALGETVTIQNRLAFYKHHYISLMKPYWFVWISIFTATFLFSTQPAAYLKNNAGYMQTAGIFTIAYADANLFLTIGKFGVRNFQVSDVRGQFTFGEYRCARRVTTAVMIAVSVCYVFICAYDNSYSVKKALIILWMCLYKAVDAAEDVYYGAYQQHGRLDIGAKAMTLRMAATVFIFAALILFTKDLLLALECTTIAASALAFYLIRTSARAFSDKLLLSVIRKNVVNLLWLCLPLFLSAFLSFYIGNAPKYAIDAVLSDELQACYGFIAMPVFVIGLLNNFMFVPMIFQMSRLLENRQIREFRKKIRRQIQMITVITAACLAAAWVCGIPILSWLYHTDLSAYKNELLVMLLGGGFLGLSGFFQVILTIMRNNGTLLTGYAAVAVMALAFSNVVVRTFGMMGAALFYMGLMFVLCVIFGIILYSSISGIHISNEL